MPYLQRHGDDGDGSYRDADTREYSWSWIINRPAMRDGTKGYEWHTEKGTGRRSRCFVHVL